MDINRWVEDFNTLSEEEKQIIDRHLRTSGSLRKFEDLLTHLTSEMHTKKAEVKKGRYSIFNPIAESYYDYYLFLGENGRHTMNPFPSRFRCDLENALFKEVPGTRTSFDIVKVYYGDGQVPRHYGYSSFDPQEWSLEETEEMTKKDIQVMQKLRDEFLTFLDQCITILQRHGMEKRCLKEVKRIKKAFSKVE
jgi:hypothetical protein